MQHIIYGENTTFPVAILLKVFIVDGQADKVKQFYVDPLVAKGVDINDIIVIGLPYTEYSKVTAATIKEAVPEVQKFMDLCGCQHVFVADTPYLKKFAKLKKLSNLAGILLPSVMGSQRLFKGRVFTTYRFDDKAEARVNMSLDALVESYNGTYAEKDILHDAYYPETPEEIRTALNGLLQYDMLAVDIEGFGLRLDDAGVGTIAFSWDEHSGIAFSVDYLVEGQVPSANQERRNILLEFLLEFSDQGGKTIYHGIAYDVKQLVANLFMQNDLLNYPAMVDGIRTLTQNAYCTKDISYLATNSAGGNTLGLKHLALEFTGRYAIDVEDITLHPVPTVLEYNLKDTCATFWLYKKNYAIMKERKQEQLYLDVYQRNQRTLITIELTGMPLDIDEVIRLRLELDAKERELLADLRKLPEVTAWVRTKGILAHEAYQNSVKGDGRTLENYIAWKQEELEFAPTQDQALVWILHTYYGLEVVDRTKKTKEPSVADSTLEKHVQWVDAGNVTLSEGNVHFDKTVEVLDFLSKVREYLKITKINGTFVKAFITKSIKKKDGVYYLHGGLNQGGTISGRLSSNSPNLQNLPSGGYWGKAIKKCFSPPKGKVMVSSDFNALEARIAALLTKDKNMLKVYTDGFDSHSLNTYAYADGTEDWFDKITDPEDPESINQIMEIADTDRKNSKPTTFALQFFGNDKTLMNNQGYSEEKSVRLVEAFHALYTDYFSFIAADLDQGAKDGYITLAYGLRLDLPASNKSVVGSKVTPQAVEAERRSAGNAKCQSFGCVNTMAADMFMRRVWDSKWKYEIQIQGLIHDAIYLFVPASLEAVAFVNDNLIECMSSQTHPDIYHPTVKLEAELDIHYANWSNHMTLPNGASPSELATLIQQYYKDMQEK
jgi:DNA polymerase-1